MGSVIGAVYTAGPIYAEHWNAPWLSGTLPAVLSAGAMLGNATWTKLRWNIELYPRIITLTTAYTASWLGLLAATSPAHAVLAITVSGLFFGPLLTACYHAVDRLAPPGTTVEAFSLLVSAVYIGLALGTRTAGAFPNTPAIPPLAAAALLLLLATLLRPALEHRPGKVQPSTPTDDRIGPSAQTAVIPHSVDHQHPSPEHLMERGPAAAVRSERGGATGQPRHARRQR